MACLVCLFGIVRFVVFFMTWNISISQNTFSIASLAAVKDVVCMLIYM